MAFYFLNENGTDRYLLEDDSGLLLIEEQFGPPGGQAATTGLGTVAKVLSIALVGLSLAVGQGTVAAQNADGAAGLTGSELTSATGTVTQSADVALTGRAATFSQGAMYGTGRSLLQASQGTASVAMTIPLAGQSLTGEQGLATPNADGTVPLLGSVGVLATGTIATPNDVPLTGSASTFAAGTLTPALRGDTFAGQSLTSAQGTITIAENNVTVNLGGDEIISAQGVLDSRPILAGNASTSALGSVVQSAEVAVLGQALTIGQGAVGLGQDPDDTFIQSASGAATIASTVPLSGTALTGAQGTVSLTADTFQPVTGHESTSTSGTTGVTASVPLTGTSLTGLQSSVGAPGGATLTGEALTAAQGDVSTTNDRIALLTGAVTTGATGSLAANPRLPLTSVLAQFADGVLGRSGGNMQQAVSGQRITSGQGVLGVIGQTVQPPGVSNEGCGITSAVAAEQNQPASQTGGEGCFTQSGTAREV